jgi:signal transduction histidine kinase
MLVHQTFRLNSIIEDLMLLSRLDSGRLQLSLGPVDLARVVATCLDDLQLLHEENAPEVEIDVRPALHVTGDARYTMLIVQNLLENAYKYGRRGEAIRVNAMEEPGFVLLSVANRGEAIPRAAWEHIFERFHRRTIGESIPGHGLGLNLARELARLHGGDLRLIRSDGEWTEFQVKFRSAPTPSSAFVIS